MAHFEGCQYRPFIASTIGAGIISLTVFCFSLVMIVLNQAPSQMSNRMLKSMIGNRFQHFALGVSIGSIVYALFLLTNIRDINSGIYVPALSIYWLLLITVLDIFIFIDFMHYVAQSVMFGTIIDRVPWQRTKTLHQFCTTQLPSAIVLPEITFREIGLPDSGYYQQCNKKELTKLACKDDGVVHFIHPPGTFLLKGTPLFNFYGAKKLSESEIEDLTVVIDFYNGQPIDINPYYGFVQFAEVAIKAVSRGINDPETAVLSLDALTDLVANKLHHFNQSVFEDENGIARMLSFEGSFEKPFEECYFLFGNRGKRIIMNKTQCSKWQCN